MKDAPIAERRKRGPRVHGRDPGSLSFKRVDRTRQLRLIAYELRARKRKPLFMGAPR
jgi:hypothetical protein